MWCLIIWTDLPFGQEHVRVGQEHVRATGIRLYKLGSSHPDVGTFHRPQNIHSVLVRRVDCHERQTNPYLEDGGAIPSTTAARKSCLRITPSILGGKS